MKQLRFKLKTNPVTLIIGIVCKDEIVVAADSRTTFPSHVEDHTKKLRIIEFQHGQALIAWSGYTAFAVDTVDVLEREATNLKPEHFRDLAELAKRVLDEMRTREMAPYRGTMVSVESVQAHLRDNVQFNLMLAYYFQDQPYLYTLSFPSGSIYREQSHFSAEGQNASLGSFLLKEYTQPAMDKETAAAIAVYVIESVGEHDRTVGGMTKVAVVRRPQPLPDPLALLPHSMGGTPYIPLPDYSPQAQLLSDSAVLKISKIAAKVKASISHRHTKQLKDELKRQTRKEIEAMMADLYPDEMPGLEGYPKRKRRKKQ